MHCLFLPRPHLTSNNIQVNLIHESINSFTTVNYMCDCLTYL